MLLQPAYINGHERKTFAVWDRITLFPVTLGHIQILAEMESNICFPPIKIEMSDVAKVIAVCSYQSWQEARTRIDADSADLIAMMKGMNHSQMREGIKVVHDFIRYYMAMPAMRNVSASYEEARVPWWWSHAEFLQTDLHRSEQNAWSTIVCDSFAYYASYTSRTNADDLSNPVLSVRELFFAEQIKSGKTMSDLFAEGVI